MSQADRMADRLAGVVSTIPVMIAFFATQKWLVRGLTAGAVKG